MKILVAAAFVASLMAGSSFANAMPLAPTGNTGADLIRVAGGCGPGFHPTYGGRCVPNRGPVIVRPMRRCPPGLVWRYGRCRPY